MTKRGAFKQLCVLSVFAVAIFPLFTYASNTKNKTENLTFLEKFVINPLARVFEPLFEHQPTTQIVYNVSINKSEVAGTSTPFTTETEAGNSPITVQSSGLSKGEVLSWINSAVSAISPTQNIINNYVRQGSADGLANTSGRSFAELQSQIDTLSNSVSTASLSVSGGGYFSSNVGIGTTSPWTTLSVSGTTTATSFNATYAPAILQYNGDTLLRLSGTGSWNDNIFLGRNTGVNLTDGTRNTFLGSEAGHDITTGSTNTVIGNQAGYSLTTGARNVLIGGNAGNYVAGGSDNVYIGDISGQDNAGSYNVFIGSSSNASGGKSSSITIGYGVAPTASNQLVIGSNNANGLITDAYFGQGVTKASPEGITINATGGFGTNNSGANLTIAGGKSTGSAAGGNIIFQTSDAGASASTLRSLSTKAVLLGNGNFGIGTSTPNYTLTAASTTGPQLALSAGAGIAQWAFRNAGGNLYISTTTVDGISTTTVAAITVTSNGRLAIGTTTPNSSAGIHVAGGNSGGVGSTIVIDNMPGTGRAATRYAMSGAVQGLMGMAGASSDVITGDIKNDLVFRSDTGINNILFSTDIGVTASLYIASTTNVGIGNMVTPASKLVVRGAGNSSATSALNVTTLNNTSVLFVRNDGLVGIGSSTPWKTLSVNGGVAMSALSNDSTGYYVCLNTTTYVLATSTTACGASSQKYKENISDLNYGLAEVLKLRPVSFDYKDTYLKNARRQVGFIAEEVATVTPEVVAYDDNGEIQGLDYPKFSAIIVKAVQELASDLRDIVARSLTATVVYTQEIEVNKIKLKGEFCIDDTCLTKDQFKEMMLRSGVGATQTSLQQSSGGQATSTESTATSTATTTSEISTTTPIEVSTTTVDATEVQE